MQFPYRYRWTGLFILLGLSLTTWLAVRPFHSSKSQSHELTRESLTLLKEALRDSDPFLRSAAARALSDSRHPDSRAILEVALDDPYATVRLFAIESASTLSQPDALQFLSKALRDPDSSVRLTAVRISAERWHRFDEAEVLRPLLQKSIKDEDPNVSLAIHGLLGSSGHEKENMGLLLRTALQAEDVEIRIGAVFSLELMRDPEFLPILEIALSDSQSSVRAYAVRALGKIPSEKGLALISNALSDPDPSVRSSALDALASEKSNRSFPLLMVATKDKDSMVRLSAGIALTKTGRREGVKLLREALQDTDYGTRSAAARSIGHLGNKDFDNIGITEMIQWLTPLVYDENPRVRSAAIRALGMMNHAGAIRFLLPSLKDSSRRVQCYAAGGLLRILKQHQIPEESFDENT